MTCRNINRKDFIFLTKSPFDLDTLNHTLMYFPRLCPYDTKILGKLYRFYFSLHNIIDMKRVEYFDMYKRHYIAAMTLSHVAVFASRALRVWLKPIALSENVI